MGIPATLVEYLDGAGVEYQVVTHPHSESSMRTAEVAHVSGECLAKGVLLKDSDGYVLAVLPATHSVMLSSVQDLLRRPLETAPEMDLRIVFADCEMGAVPALGAAYDLDTIVDESLRDLSKIYFEAGDHEELIAVSGEDFRLLLEKSPYLKFGTHMH
jgi:Ala-tRNA(Pro) deacylase